MKPLFVKGDILVSHYTGDAGLRGAVKVEKFSAARRHYKKRFERDEGPRAGIIWRATCDAQSEPTNRFAGGWRILSIAAVWFERARLSDIREAIRKTKNKRQLARLERWLRELAAI